MVPSAANLECSRSLVIRRFLKQTSTQAMEVQEVLDADTCATAVFDVIQPLCPVPLDHALQ